MKNKKMKLSLIVLCSMFTISPLAYASLVTVSGEFLTFSASSNVVLDSATVNGIALTNTAPASSRTDTINLLPGTDKVDLTYFEDNSPFFSIVSVLHLVSPLMSM